MQLLNHDGTKPFGKMQSWNHNRTQLLEKCDHGTIIGQNVWKSAIMEP